MSYMALYRKFRPQKFEDVKGQDHIITALKNQITTGRIGHAYLFTGTRGTGKTTVAKIFARAVNCEHTEEDGSPDNTCDLCRKIMQGTSMNVIEIDAASNNSVANVREIIEEVQYPPTEGRYKVYIIDEVHMLSTGAFNALLKTLEEPPAYVIFILATTEIHKIPVTIVSRCQRYDFHRISVDTIGNRMRDLMDAENVKIEDKALDYIAKAADGSMRDALSLLDECIAFFSNSEITYEKVLNILGAVDTSIFSSLFEAVRKSDSLTAIEIIEKVVRDGRELGQFVNDFIWYLRNLMIVKSMSDAAEVIDVSEETYKVLKEESAITEKEIIMRYIRVMSELSNEMKYSSQKRILLEASIIKLARPEMEEDYGSVINRIANLEAGLKSGEIGERVFQDVKAGGVSHEFEEESEENVIKEPLPTDVPEIVKKIAGNWRSFIGKQVSWLKTILEVAYVSVSEDGKLLLVYGSQKEIEYDMLTKEEAHSYFIKQLNEYAKTELPVDIRIEAGRPENKYTDAIEAFSQEIGFPIETED